MCYNLSEEEIRRYLNKLNIIFDIDTVKQIHNHLTKYIGSLCNTETQLHVYAACAIVSQTRKIATVDKKGFTTSGIKVENIMRHLGKGISKQMYLNTIKEHLNKLTSQDSELAEKIGRLHISLRIFKKYKQIFENLSQSLGLNSQILSNYLAFFWLIFLIMKNKKKVSQEDTNKSTTILIIILEQAFGLFLKNLSYQEIKLYVIKHFPSFSEIQEKQKRELQKQILSEIEQTIMHRTSHLESFKPHHCRIDFKLLARLVDDLSNKCDIIYRVQRQENYIDQMSYLELTKDLTPQCIVQPFRNLQKVTPIKTKINFDNSDDDQALQNQFTKTQRKESQYQEIQPQVQQSTRLIATKLNFSEPNQPRIQRSMVQLKTPVSMNMEAQRYMNDIEKSNQIDFQKMNTLLLSHKISPEIFINECQKNINKCMNQQSPNLTLRQNKKNKILKLFIQFSLEISQKFKEEFFRKAQNFTEILCCAHYIHDVSTKFARLKFRKYCENYDVDLTQSAKAIFFIGQKCIVPCVIKDKIKQIQMQIYIKQIWQDFQGYKLLENQEKPENQILFKRLQFHIYERIKSICQQIKIDFLIIKKIQPLVNDIITKKISLLEFNKIDQIIICSITACLNLNLPNHSHALDTIFNSYNNVEFSSHWMSEQLYQQGRKMNLTQFYDNVFVKELSQFMGENVSKINFLLTPRKQQLVKNLRYDGQGIPLHPQASPLSGDSYFSNPKSSNNYNDLRKNLKRQLKNQGKTIEESRQEKQSGAPPSPGESPRFGLGAPKLQRKFTFGSGSN